MEPLLVVEMVLAIAFYFAVQVQIAILFSILLYLSRILFAFKLYLMRLCGVFDEKFNQSTLRPAPQRNTVGLRVPAANHCASKGGVASP
ncbi:hypothetical protein ABWH92_11985 [Ahrensia marina]|uniref:hypothetical protein n=1 Tax=Ahrensia marina TaxID=1514904 RepID=UPI0035CF2AE3